MKRRTFVGLSLLGVAAFLLANVGAIYGNPLLAGIGGTVCLIALYVYLTKKARSEGKEGMV